MLSVWKFTFAISSPDEFLVYFTVDKPLQSTYYNENEQQAVTDTMEHKASIQPNTTTG